MAHHITISAVAAFVLFIASPALAQTPPTIEYNETDNTIYINQNNSTVGGAYTLPSIAAALNRPDLLEEVSPGVWELRATLYLDGIRGATGRMEFTIDDSTVDTLRLKSDSSGFVQMRLYDTDTHIENVIITSWDSFVNGPDTDRSDGRAYILSKFTGRMDIFNSEISYLGYADGEAYGLSWRVPIGEKDRHYQTGIVEGTTIHNNHYGIYTHSVEDMVFRDNTVYDNAIYGIDPHDDSNNLLIEGNEVYRNGKHGIIISARCTNNVIRNNVSYDNVFSGFMLDRNSNSNIVEGNISYGNRDGLAIYGSSNNVIRNNTFHDNYRGLIAKDDSTGNVMENNTLYNNETYGFYTYGQAIENTFIGNDVSSAGKYGFYLKTPGNWIENNAVTTSKVGIYLNTTAASGNIIIGNEVFANDRDGIYLRDAVQTHVEGNTVHDNLEKGIVMRGATDSLIAENTIRDNDDDGLYLYDTAARNTMLRNVVDGNRDAGVYLKYVDDNYVINNTFTSNGLYGVYSFGSKNNVFSGDAFANNGNDYYYNKIESDNDIYVTDEIVTAKVGTADSVFTVINQENRIMRTNDDITMTVRPNAVTASLEYVHNVTYFDPTSLRIVPDTEADSGTAQIIEWHDNAEGTKEVTLDVGKARLTVGELYTESPYVIYLDGEEIGTFMSNSEGILTYTLPGTNGSQVLSIVNG